MANTYISTRTAKLVALRAGRRCEYCHAPQLATGQTFQIEHLIPISRGGTSSLDHLGYACPHCNFHKGNRMEATDSLTGRLVSVFNPRIMVWHEYFRWGSTFRTLIGRTAIGRATITALDLNAAPLKRAKGFWAMVGLIP